MASTFSLKDFLCTKMVDVDAAPATDIPTSQNPPCTCNCVDARNVGILEVGTRLKTLDGETAVLIREKNFVNLDFCIKMFQKELAKLGDVKSLLQEKDQLNIKLHEKCLALRKELLKNAHTDEQQERVKCKDDNVSVL